MSHAVPDEQTKAATPRWRRILRTVLDIAAIYAAWSIQFAASGSYAAAAIAAALVGLYGSWCFYDGSA